MGPPAIKNDGFQSVIEMMRVMNQSDREKLLSNIMKDNPEFAALLKQQLHSFDDLVHLSPRELQTVLKEIKEEKLALALRGQKEEIVNSILAQVPARIGESIRDLLTSGPAQKKSDVEQAQAEIVEFAKSLDREGKINLKKEANEEWVD